MKPKLLCILHQSPPAHGAAKVGDFIESSQLLKEAFDCRFIAIKSSDSISDIGRLSLKKIYLVFELYIRVFWALLVFRPSRIYYTASIKSVAFYRDLLISTLWKSYNLFKKSQVYYHYHTKGVSDFVNGSPMNLKLTKFFIKNVNIILLSPLLAKDFDQVDSYNHIIYLGNGVEDNINDKNYTNNLFLKYENIKQVKVLYLAHMMKDKGYWDVLLHAEKLKDKSIQYNFAGAWGSEKDKFDFFSFIKENNLENQVIYHGFVNGERKSQLFNEAHLLLYPSKNDAFPLTLLESLSYGVPVVASKEGSIPYILDKRSGIIIDDSNNISHAVALCVKQLLNVETALYCRNRFKQNFSLEQFEINLVEVLK
jgi:glycosyltransferase involved in cell wall biosynthesis